MGGGGLHLCDPPPTRMTDTPPFSLCWWCFFIFSTDRVSSVPTQQPEVLSNTTPRALQQLLARSAACVPQTLVLWAGDEEAVTRREKTKDARWTFGKYKIAKSLWCSAVDLKGYRGKLLAGNQNREAGKGNYMTTIAYFEDICHYILFIPLKLLMALFQPCRAVHFCHNIFVWYIARSALWK